MKKIIPVAIVILLSTISCAQNNVPTSPKGAPRIIGFQFVRNAEYGYNYVLPYNVQKELIGSSKDYNVFIYNSNDNTFQIRILSEFSFNREEKNENLENYYQKIQKGNHNEIQNSIILENKINFDDGTFIVKGKTNGKEFIWKTFVSEIPVSGELICNSMIFYYSKSRKNKFLGKTLIEKFGGRK